MKKLFIGNLPYDNFLDNELKELFEQAGEVVSAKVIVDRYSDRSKGFGFVEYANEDSAKKAIEDLDGHSVGGRNIVVKEALEKQK